MKTISVTVQISVPDGMEELDLLENCDYQFSYDGEVLATEITEAFNASDQKMF